MTSHYTFVPTVVFSGSFLPIPPCSAYVSQTTRTLITHHVTTLARISSFSDAEINPENHQLKAYPHNSSYPCPPPLKNLAQAISKAALFSILALAITNSGNLSTILIPSAQAVSGGGKDFASKDWSGQDFANKSYVGKDFSGCIARGTDFKNSDLRGARFFKADLNGADFTGANLAAASLEGAALKKSIFENAILKESYFNESIMEIENMKGADFTDALIPEISLSKLCQRTDIDAKNPTTGYVTRDTLMCP